MNVKIVRMRQKGVAIERRMLNDRYTPSYAGRLVIKDTTDQGLRRQVKVAQLVMTGMPRPNAELLEPHILWANDGRFVLAGFERLQNDQGQTVDYAQSWLCTLDTPAPAAEKDATELRR